MTLPSPWLKRVRRTAFFFPWCLCVCACCSQRRPFSYRSYQLCLYVVAARNASVLTLVLLRDPCSCLKPVDHIQRRHATVARIGDRDQMGTTTDERQKMKRLEQDGREMLMAVPRMPLASAAPRVPVPTRMPQPEIPASACGQPPSPPCRRQNAATGGEYNTVKSMRLRRRSTPFRGLCQIRSQISPHPPFFRRVPRVHSPAVYYFPSLTVSL